MDHINLKDILTGKLTKLPLELDMDEKHDLVVSLADALAALQYSEFPDVTINSDGKQRSEELQKRHDEWSEFTDNFLQFLMDEDNVFSIELAILGLINALRRHHLWFDSTTDTFTAFYRKYSMWIVSGEMEFYPVEEKTAEDYEKEIFESGEEAKETPFGGNFTLRDHHISKEIHSRIDKIDKDQ
jgi:hypothetical protein